MSSQGLVMTQQIIVNSLLKSGALNRQILVEEVTITLQSLTDEQKTSEFSAALTQFGNMLGIRADPLPIKGDDTAWEETARLIDRLQRR
jgi:hypothetical protein